ncbi:MAG: mechanosensitive ion channel family protein [Planctomycetota bacterium]|nr:mechanosensitive ion channel family protein [Planctomycetota bacterium]
MEFAVESVTIVFVPYLSMTVVAPMLRAVYLQIPDGLDSGNPKSGSDSLPQEPGWMETAVVWARELLQEVDEARWVQAVISIAVFLVAAKLLDFLITALLKLFSRKTKTLLDDHLIELLHKPVIQSFALFGVLVTMAILGPSESTSRFVTRVATSFIMLSWVVFFLRASRSLLKAASKEDARLQIIEPRTYPLFSNLATVVILAVGTWCLISLWGADMTGWLASAGVVGLAVGFAAQDTLSNLFAGVFVIADAPFRVGDYIVLDTGDRGKVIHIGLRSTRLMTRDDVEITIPNSVIGGGRITNQSSGSSKSMRIKLPVQVAYGSDVDELRALLMKLAADEPQALDYPEPRVRFRMLADSGLNFDLMVWVRDPSLRGLAVDALNTAIYKELAKAGIEIPYPKMDMYLRKE